MAKGKRTEGQTTKTKIYKTLHRKLRSSNTNPAKNRGSTRVLRNGK